MRAARVLARIAARVSQEDAGAPCGDGMSADAVTAVRGSTRSKAPTSCS